MTERSLVAVHEAGHLAAYHHHGFLSAKAAIRDDGSGETRFRHKRSFTKRGEDTPFVYAVCALAGPVAQWKVSGDTTGCQSDFDAAVRAVGVERIGEAWREARRLVEAHWSDIVQNARRLRDGPTDRERWVARPRR